MSAKIIGPYKLMDAVSLGASVNSTSVDVTRLIYASIAIEWTGNPAGDLNFEARNGESSWMPITGITQALGGAPGSKLFEFDLLPWEQMRITYTRTSGTGSISAHFVAKGW